MSKTGSITTFLSLSGEVTTETDPFQEGIFLFSQITMDFVFLFTLTILSVNSTSLWPLKYNLKHLNGSTRASKNPEEGSGRWRIRREPEGRKEVGRTYKPNKRKDPGEVDGTEVAVEGLQRTFCTRCR